MTTRPTPPPRIRFRLLVLLWIWSACVFLVVDLIFNVPEFDRARPRSSLYEGMRAVAHTMAGIPYRDDPARDSDPPFPRRQLEDAEGLRAALARVRQAIHDEDFAGLRDAALHESDARVRIKAMEALAKANGDAARAMLVRIANDERETPKVRRHSARCVGLTGEGGLDALETLLATMPREACAGAVNGLVELGTREAGELLIALATGGPSAVQLAATTAIASLRSVELLEPLARRLEDPRGNVHVRIACARALGRGSMRPAAQRIALVLENQLTADEIRIAAAEALGLLGDPATLDLVVALSDRSHGRLSTEAKLARSRLERAAHRVGSSGRRNDSPPAAAQLRRRR